MRRRLRAAPIVCAVLLISACSAPAPEPTRDPDRSMPRVPLVPGEVVARTGGAGDWHVWVRSADPEQGYADARALLRRSGLTLTKDRPGTGGGDGQACSADLCVGFTGHDDPVHGPVVEYDVFLPATAGAP